MKQTITKEMFQDRFTEMRKFQFTLKALSALYDYLLEYEESIGTEIELDVIALCCEYTEYRNIEEFQMDNGEDCRTIEEIEKLTSVIRFSHHSFIISSF